LFHKIDPRFDEFGLSSHVVNVHGDYEEKTMRMRATRLKFENL
jgi:hypothetical protein